MSGLRVGVLMVVGVCLLGFGAATHAEEEQEEGLTVGDAAPEWTLAASDGKTYSLSQFKGKQPVVLAFFPRAFTRGCTVQCQNLASEGEAIDATGAAHFMISIDTVEDNTRFAEEHGAGFPILADPEKETSEAYGVLTERGFASRVTFYIDEEGVIRRIDREVKPVSAAADTVRQLIELGLAKREE